LRLSLVFNDGCLIEKPDTYIRDTRNVSLPGYKIKIRATLQRGTDITICLVYNNLTGFQNLSGLICYLGGSRAFAEILSDRFMSEELVKSSVG